MFFGPSSSPQSLAEVLNVGSDAGGADITGLGAVAADSFAGDGSALTGLPSQIGADIWPTSDAEGVLTNDGAGNLSWGAGGGGSFADILAASGDGGGNDISNINSLAVNYEVYAPGAAFTGASFAGDGSALTGLPSQIGADIWPTSDAEGVLTNDGDGNLSWGAGGGGGSPPFTISASEILAENGEGGENLFGMDGNGYPYMQSSAFGYPRIGFDASGNPAVSGCSYNGAISGSLGGSIVIANGIIIDFSPTT